MVILSDGGATLPIVSMGEVFGQAPRFGKRGEPHRVQFR